MPDKLIVMPDSSDMLLRLQQLQQDPHIYSGLYPRICRLADQELYPIGVVLGITLAIHDYTEGMPPVMANLVMKFVPRYLEVLIDDEEARQEALRHFDSAVEASTSSE